MLNKIIHMFTEKPKKTEKNSKNVQKRYCILSENIVIYKSTEEMCRTKWKRFQTKKFQEEKK